MKTKTSGVAVVVAQQRRNQKMMDQRFNMVATIEDVVVLP